MNHDLSIDATFTDSRSSIHFLDPFNALLDQTLDALFYKDPEELLHVKTGGHVYRPFYVNKDRWSLSATATDAGAAVTYRIVTEAVQGVKKWAQSLGKGGPANIKLLLGRPGVTTFSGCSIVINTFDSGAAAGSADDDSMATA